MRERSVRTREVALLVAVPVEEAAFRRAWARGSDYLRRIYDDVDAGWSSYTMLAHVAHRLCIECRELGAAVVLEAGLSDVAAHASRCVATAVMTHMAFPSVDPDDVRDPDALLRLVATAQEPEWQLVRSALKNGDGLTEILAAINRLLTETHRQLSAPPCQDPREAEVLARQRRSGFGLLRFDRSRLDELCGDAVLSPGAGIEMKGGMITTHQFIGALPADYDGFLDLRMCNSISLGAAIRRMRPGARVAVGRRSAFLDASLLLFKTALRCMAAAERSARPVTYEQAMRLVTEANR